MTGWIDDAVFYEVYPQSFADSDGDGVGDLPGAAARLDHLAWIGVDAVWFNPCFASPFADAGYDVSDYPRIAPRYGTNDDMVRFVEAARERGIRVVLDLVAGHTSVEHAWFRASAQDPADDRYVWSDRPGPGFVALPGTRPGYYLKNFYEVQPALNFGYGRAHPDEPWRQPVDAPGPRANRAALREVIGFWLDRGIAGFRVDMAYSLVKDDPGFAATAARDDPDSTLSRVRRLIALRRATPALRTAAPTTVLTRGYPLGYLRRPDHLVVVNPRREPGRVDLPRPAPPLEAAGATAGAGGIDVAGFGYGVFVLS